MLCITMRCGDYFVVGDDTVIQLDQLGPDRVHLTIHAPREVPIVRGEVLERSGGKRPDCVYDLSAGQPGPERGKAAKRSQPRQS